MTDIYELLKSGKSAEEIAAEFAVQLNDAQTRVEAERIEEVRQAEIAKQAKNAAKHADFADVVHDFFCTIGRHYPDLGIHEDDITEEVCDAMADLVIMAIDMEATRATFGQKTKARKVLPVKIELKNDKNIAEDAFMKFFREFGL